MFTRKTFVALFVSAVALGYVACGGSQGPQSGIYSPELLNGVSQAPPIMGPVPGSSASPPEPSPPEPPPPPPEPVDAGVVIMDSGVITDVPSAPVDSGRRGRTTARRDAGR